MKHNYYYYCHKYYYKSFMALWILSGTTWMHLCFMKYKCVKIFIMKTNFLQNCKKMHQTSNIGLRNFTVTTILLEH